MRLHLVKGKYKGSLYCGPTALCSVTGLPSECIINAIHQYRRNDEEIVGMWMNEMQGVLKNLGFKARYRWIDYETTLEAYCQKLIQRRKTKLRIVSIYGHVLAISGLYVYDTAVTTPVLVEDHPRCNWRVKDVLIINGGHDQ